MRRSAFTRQAVSLRRAAFTTNIMYMGHGSKITEALLLLSAIVFARSLAKWAFSAQPSSVHWACSAVDTMN